MLPFGLHSDEMTGDHSTEPRSEQVQAAVQHVTPIVVALARDISALHIHAQAAHTRVHVLP